MENWFTTFGTIVYDPDRGRMKSNTTWWCVIELHDPEIADYYRWMVDRYWWDADVSPVKRQYVKSPHKPHISLIRGEEPRINQSLWGKYMAGDMVTIRYSNAIRQTSTARIEATDKFWFLEVEWPPYVDFRRLYGLNWHDPSGKKFRPHMTIAQTHDLNPAVPIISKV